MTTPVPVASSIILLYGKGQFGQGRPSQDSPECDSPTFYTLPGGAIWRRIWVIECRVEAERRRHSTGGRTRDRFRCGWVKARKVDPRTVPALEENHLVLQVIRLWANFRHFPGLTFSLLVRPGGLAQISESWSTRTISPSQDYAFL